MPTRDIIVIGASAGGVQALLEIVRELPGDLPASIFVVIHVSPDSPGVLPQLLAKAGPLPADFAEDGEKIEGNRIYVARPDHHLLLVDSKVEINRGPRQNGFRPAVDPLFRSAAEACGPRVIGVVLSGGLDDGSAGLQEIKRRGGLAIVQDPATAIHTSMPASAIQHTEVDLVVPISQMAAVLAEQVRLPIRAAARAIAQARGGRLMAVTNRKTPAGDGAGAGAGAEQTRAADLTLAAGQSDIPGKLSGFVCPECGGALWERANGKLLKFRCHVGHTYTADGLLSANGQSLENAMWTALRTLEEHAALCRRMASRMTNSPIPALIEIYERRARDAEQRAALVREALLSERVTAAVPGVRAAKAGRKSNLSAKLAKKNGRAGGGSQRGSPGVSKGTRKGARKGARQGSRAGLRGRGSAGAQRRGGGKTARSGKRRNTRKRSKS